MGEKVLELWDLSLQFVFISLFFFHLSFNNRKRTFKHVRWPATLSFSYHVKVGCPANAKLTVNSFVLQLSLGRFHSGGASSLNPRSIDFQGGFCWRTQGGRCHLDGSLDAETKPRQTPKNASATPALLFFNIQRVKYVSQVSARCFVTLHRQRRRAVNGSLIDSFHSSLLDCVQSEDNYYNRISTRTLDCPLWENLLSEDKTTRFKGLTAAAEATAATGSISPQTRSRT